MLIDPIKIDVGRSFFKELFQICSQTRDMFGDHPEQQWLQLIGAIQHLLNHQLRSMLTLPVTATHSKEAITPEIAQLAQNYVDRGFTPQHMGHIQQAIFLSLSAHLGGRFEENTAEAWSQFISLVINSMNQIMTKHAIQPALPNEQSRAVRMEGKQIMDILFTDTGSACATSMKANRP